MRSVKNPPFLRSRIFRDIFMVTLTCSQPCQPCQTCQPSHPVPAKGVQGFIMALILSQSACNILERFMLSTCFENWPPSPPETVQSSYYKLLSVVMRCYVTPVLVCWDYLAQARTTNVWHMFFSRIFVFIPCLHATDAKIIKRYGGLSEPSTKLGLLKIAMLAAG